MGGGWGGGVGGGGGGGGRTCAVCFIFSSLLALSSLRVLDACMHVPYFQCHLVCLEIVIRSSTWTWWTTNVVPRKRSLAGSGV